MNKEIPPTRDELRRVNDYLTGGHPVSPGLMRERLLMTVSRIWACMETLDRMTDDEKNNLKASR